MPNVLIRHKVKDYAKWKPVFDFKALKNVMNVLMMLLLICFCLLLIGCSQDVNSLIKKLNDEKPKRRLEAVSALGKLRDSRAVEPLIAVLKKEKDETVRARVAWALGQIENPFAVEPLVATLKDEDLHFRFHAVWALGEIKDPRTIGSLIAALNDKDPNVIARAGVSLGGIGKPAVEALIVALKDEKPRIRWGAAWALQSTKDPRAVEPLIGALEDDNSHVRTHAKMALMEITGTDFGDNPEEWRKWWEENKETIPKPFLVEVPLSGAGVESEPPPEERIAEIREFFDASIGTGDLVGDGPGGSAQGGLNVLRNMIEAAGDLIEVGDTAGACQQLSDAYERSDGEFPPPDFVTGDDASELAIIIQSLMTYLGCIDKL